MKNNVIRMLPFFIRHGLAEAIAFLAIVMLAWSASGQVFADADITFHGTLLEDPPCVVNNGDDVLVDFGDEMMTSRIDGIQYRQQIEFTFDCSDPQTSALKLRISGESVITPDGEVLRSPLPGLGIAIDHGGIRYTPGEWITFKASKVPELFAAPVRLSDAGLDGGTFSIRASLVVDYQ